MEIHKALFNFMVCPTCRREFKEQNPKYALGMTYDQASKLNKTIIDLEATIALSWAYLPISHQWVIGRMGTQAQSSPICISERV
jgi:hypothetical protein